MTAKPEIGPALTLEPTVSLGVVQASRPAELVRVATEAAKALAEVIEKQKLYSTIQGKRFVKCEGWTTLAAMLGSTPHEVGVMEADGGIFTATVELRRLSDGQPIARASAECGAPDEIDRNGKAIWASRPRYARRSMALTRATAKACRLAFSWVMVLAGFQPTPAEEIPDDEPRRRPPTATELTEVPVPLRAPDPMPWETIPADEAKKAPRKPEALRMPSWKGKPLSAMPVEDLKGLRAWLVKNNSDSKWVTKIDEVDTALASHTEQSS